MLWNENESGKYARQLDFPKNNPPVKIMVNQNQLQNVEYS